MTCKCKEHRIKNKNNFKKNKKTYSSTQTTKKNSQEILPQQEIIEESIQNINVIYIKSINK